MSGIPICDDSGLCHTIDVACVLPEERVLRCDTWSISLVDISPVVLGHSMVCPPAHALSTRELGHERAADIWRAADSLGREICGLLGTDSFALVEHGVSPDLPAGGCVRHAHVHVCPLFANTKSGYSWAVFRRVCRASQTFGSFIEASRSVKGSGSYLLARLGDGVWASGVPRADIRQVSRVLLAELNGMDSTIIDWAIAANGALFRESLRRLSGLKTPDVAYRQ
jgi:diadenosine tetraphosphate (Ap4A) HIT family hydrolase